MKAIVKFYDNCIRIISETAKRDKKVSMGYIEQTLSGEKDVIGMINSMKFLKPTMPENEVFKYFDDLHALIDQRFQELYQFWWAESANQLLDACRDSLYISGMYQSH